MNHPAWEILQHHLVTNMPEYLIFFSALLVATVCTMPENPPSSVREWWTWMRNSLQTAVPAARARNEAHSSTTITPTTTKQEATASTAVDPPNQKETI